MNESATLKENEILRQRAQVLAQSPDKQKEEGAQITVIEFKLGNETYAVETRYVSEVFALREFTPIPGVPSFVLGIASVRGEIISINDLKQLLGLPPGEAPQIRKVIILEDEQMRFGIVVDSLYGARPLTVSQLQSPPGLTGGTQRDYVIGVTAKNVYVLGGDRLLQDDTLRIDAAAQIGGVV